MAVSSTAAPVAAPAGAAADPAIVRRRLRRLAILTAVWTYGLIVFGGIVRITGSGLGCGDDWPRCNGHWIPPMDFATLIEYTHRLLAAGLAVPFLALAAYAARHRATPGVGGPRGAARLVGAAVTLLVVQVLLGAITVKLDLPAAVTSLHFITASLLLAYLLAAAVRAGREPAAVTPAPGAARGALLAFWLGLAVVAMGALTANTGLPAASGNPSGAAFACQGFPLCNGSVVPDGGSWVWIHWIHRLLAFALLFYIPAATLRSRRRGAPGVVTLAAAVASALVVAQVAVAAALVLLGLPDLLQALHLTVGVTLWVALVVWTALARREAAPA